MMGSIKLVAIAGCLMATAGVCALGAGFAVADGVEVVHVPAKIETARIDVPLPPRGDSLTKGRTFTFGIDTSPCLGLGATFFREVKVVERPITKARPYKSTVIYAVVEHPAWNKHVTKVGTEYRSPCPAIATSISKRIKLKRPAADLIFFDGSSSPPRRIYPAIGR